jgi:RHS repeat-associated protein
MCASLTPIQTLPFWGKENSATNGSYSRSTPLVSRYDVLASATTSWNGTALGNFTARYTDARGWRNGQDSGSSSGTSSESWSRKLGLGDGLASGTYTFDGFGQLTNVPTPGWQGSQGSQSLAARNFGWSYDLAGNRTAESGAATTSYTADSLNRYSAITGTLGESPLTHDADGNLTQDGTWTYTYNAENQLITMSRSGQALSFAYDYLGRRIRKTVTGTGAADTKFLWSGWRLVAELAADGSSVQKSFVWGPDFSDAQGDAGGAGGLLAQITSGGSVTYAMPDALGNIVGYVNSGGTLSAAVEYSQYGRAINAYGSYGSYPLGFSGQYTDWETGLIYYGRRYYNPKHGRFINRDPIEEAGGLNLYGFVGNNPLNARDVLGLGEELGGAPSWVQSTLKQMFDYLRTTTSFGQGALYASLLEQIDRDNYWVPSSDPLGEGNAYLDHLGVATYRRQSITGKYFYTTLDCSNTWFPEGTTTGSGALKGDRVTNADGSETVVLNPYTVTYHRNSGGPSSAEGDAATSKWRQVRDQRDVLFERARAAFAEFHKRGVSPGGGPLTDHSCQTVNSVLLAALGPFPKGWNISLERRATDRGFQFLDIDHWAVVAKTPGPWHAEYLFDYWGNRPIGESPETWFRDRFPRLMPQDGAFIPFVPQTDLPIKYNPFQDMDEVYPTKPQ